MKGTIFDIRRFAVHDGPGIRTSVFFKGCPLSCQWCHNPESIDIETFKSNKKVKIDGEWYTHTESVGTVYTVDEVLKIVLRDKIFFEESGGGVTFSGGEPLMQCKFLNALLKACRQEGLHTAVDTCGYAHRKLLDLILPFTDLFLYDFKHYNAAKHKQSTGASNEIIIENLQHILKKGKRVFIRIPVIPTFNNSEKDMIEMMILLKSLSGNIEKVDLLPFHTLGKNKYRRFHMNNPMEGIPGLKKQDLISLQQVFESGGFRVSIGG